MAIIRLLVAITDLLLAIILVSYSLPIIDHSWAILGLLATIRGFE